MTSLDRLGTRNRSITGELAPGGRSRTRPVEADASSPRETIAENQVRVAHADARSTTSHAEAAILTRLRDLTANGMAAVPGVGAGSLDDFDYMAVRSSPAATPEFSGGSQTFGFTSPAGTTLFFAGGEQPSAYKGCLIKYGPEASAADKATMQRAAVTFLGDHLDDHKVAGGRWNRPLIDSYA